MSVVAELHHKLNPAGSSDASRMEDTLTDAVFSALKYLPWDRGLAPFLSLAGGPAAGMIDDGDVTIDFWPKLPSLRTASGFVEPDVLIAAAGKVVCVEAKFRATFGRYADPGDGLGPLHQLAVQAQALVDTTHVGSDAVVLAVTDAPDFPAKEFATARTDLGRLGVDPRGVTLAWMGWHQIGALLKDMTGLSPNEQALRDDVVDFLTLRKVLSVYKPIDPKDWAVIGQATAVGADRVFPAIAVFQRNLEQSLVPDGIVWGHPQKGVQFSSTTSLDRASAWFQGRVLLPWWFTGWGELTDAAKFWLGLYTCFDFTEAAIEVGFAVAPPNAAAATNDWVPVADELARELAALPLPSGEVAVAGNVISPSTASIASDEINTGWLIDRFNNFSGCLMLRKRLPADSSITAVRANLLELLDVISQCPTLMTLYARGPRAPRAVP